MILQRYLRREVLGTFVAVLTLLLLIYLSSRFVTLLADAAAGKLLPNMIAKMLVLKLLTALVIIFPLSLFLAVLLAIGRMQQDREITIMANAGMGWAFVLRSIVVIALPLSAVVAVMALQVAPWSERHIHQFEEVAKEEHDVTGITAGQFREFSHGDRILYVERTAAGGQRMENVFLQARQNGRLGVLTSNSAHFQTDPHSGNRFAVFSNGNRYTGTPGQLDYSITHYQTYGVRIDQKGVSAALQLNSMPSMMLWHLGGGYYLGELQWRIGAPIATLLLAVLGVVMARTSLGGSRYAAVLAGIFIYFTYSNMLGIARGLTKRGDVPTYVGLWWVHLVLIVVLLVLWFYPAYRRRRRAKQPPQLLKAGP